MNKLKAYSKLNKCLTALRDNGIMVEVIGLSTNGVIIHIPDSFIFNVPKNETFYSLWNTGLSIVPDGVVLDLTTGKLHMQEGKLT